ncbi:DUF2975 domain-containing protein [Salmonella enterica subsp. diarizonae]|nr:DUF2975 domain-containing protein [Salmonella enterica subsp. diarizonae]
MYPNRLSRISQHMATVSLFFLISMLLLNSACWLFPNLSSIDGGYGLSFALTDRLISNTGVHIGSLPWWQIAGGIILSGVPLLALSYGLYHLRLLFKLYGQREYFSVRSASSFENVGKAIIIWKILSLLLEPLLSYWITFRAGVGHRVISLSFDSQDVVAFFVASCIILIAQILRRATDLQNENQQFV